MAEFKVDTLASGADEIVKPKPKKIVICCDGTWQSAVTNTINIPSNVTRICRYLEKAGIDDDGSEWQQIVYYDAGIGTGVSSTEASRQGGTGSGFVGNVIEAYNFIVMNYWTGDKIFCVGFSRGAYTARAVAGLVTDIGVIRPRDMQDFAELYRTYQANTDSHGFRQSKAWREWVEGERLFNPAQKGLPKQLRNETAQWVKRRHYAAPESTRWVEAVAVFDTVGSLGIPDTPGLLTKAAGWVFGEVAGVEKAGFHNVNLSPFIKNAYHALALDEHRKPFGPTLWHYSKPLEDTSGPRVPLEQAQKIWDDLDDDAPEDQTSQAWADLVDAEMAAELKGTRSHLVQCWFPGVHINIGGGNDDMLHDRVSDFEQISMVTLTWMVHLLNKHLTFRSDFTTISTTDRFVLMAPVVDDLLAKNQKNHWLVKRINSILSKDPKDPFNDGNKTRSRIIAADALRGWATGPINDSYVGMMKLGGYKDRTPGEYNETKVDNKIVQLAPANEYIHPCLKYRMESQGAEYDCIPLRNFKRQRKTDSNGVVSYEWVKGNVRIPEWKIGADSWERYVVSSPPSKIFLGKLDKEYGIDSEEARAVPA